MDELLDIQSTLAFEENGCVYLRRAVTSDERVTLTVELWTGIDDGSEWWEVQCADSLRFQIANDSRGSCRLVMDDPLVWEHTDPGATVGILGRTTEPLKAAAALYAAHARIACRWRRAPVIPFERYVRHPDIEGFLAGGHGFLASGPERLMRAYAEALTPYGLGPYLSAAVGAYYPQRTGIENVPDAPGEPPLKALLVGSATFVVGRVLTAHRIAGPPPD